MLSPNEALDTPDADKKMIGSLMIFEASSYAEVKALIESDVYWTGNVVRMILSFPSVDSIVNTDMP